LGPLLFLIYINDLIDCCENYSEIYLFADDAKLFHHILHASDHCSLQSGINELQDWTQNWLLKININKCKVLTVGRDVDKNNTYSIIENNKPVTLQYSSQCKDLGVLIDEKLNFRDHIHEKINKAYSMLGIIKRNFKYLNIQCFTLLYKSMVRSHLDYCSSVWNPYHKGDIEALEKVQKRATKILPEMKHLSYCDRLRACNLTTLHYRRIRGDMIETYKIVTGKYDTAVSPKLEKVDSYITRGNDLRLHKRRTRYDLRKYCFTNRIVDVWNCLPNWVVSADTTNNFKTRLDKHWHNQDIIYDFTAQLHGIGSRSESLN